MRYVSAGAVLGLCVFAAGFLGGSAVDVTMAAGLEAVQTPVPTENPVPATEESITKGRQVYARFCRSCHGAEGKGDGGGIEGVTPANLIDDTWDHGSTDPEIFVTISEGVGPDLFMEPWAGRISDEDIWNVINYIRDLGKRVD
jgi:mono/diheme cytochrome c family protein